MFSPKEKWCEAKAAPARRRTHGPKQRHSTAPTREQEALVVAFLRHTLLALQRGELFRAHGESLFKSRFRNRMLYHIIMIHSEGPVSARSGDCVCRAMEDDGAGRAGMECGGRGFQSRRLAASPREIHFRVSSATSIATAKAMQTSQTEAGTGAVPNRALPQGV